MAREEKERVVEQIADWLSRSTIAILTDYRGLRVAELEALRKRLRQSSVELHVVKNSLARFAAEKADRGAVIPDLDGPTAIAFGFQDPTETAKALADFLKTNRVLSIKAAVMGDRRLEAAQVAMLAALPPPAVVRARLVSAIQGPMAGVVSALDGLLAQLAFLVEQRTRQLETAIVS